MTIMTAAQVRAQTALMEQVPDPEVPERPRPPRTYPAAYKLRILEEYEQLDKQGKGALAAFTAPRGRHRSTRWRARTSGCSGRTPGCASSWSRPAR
jgi:hypothetical protein